MVLSPVVSDEQHLQTELSGHLGYEKGDPAASANPNSRNGSTPKTVASQVGDVELAIPRDRDGSFTPRLVPKGSRRLGGLDDMTISLYAGGMTVRDIEHHLASTIGTELSHETISNITDQVADEVATWQDRPLDALYPVIYLDAIVVKVGDGAHVTNKAAHIAVGVDMDGIKHVLGIWLQTNEGAKFWAGVCADLANRGVKDVLIVCCDGLPGLPEAIEATWAAATVQTCVVHLIRAAMRFVGYGDRKKVAAALKPIYTAANAKAARAEFESFRDGPWGKKYPHAVATWEAAWERFIPFLAFPPELRRVKASPFLLHTDQVRGFVYATRPGRSPRSKPCVERLDRGSRPVRSGPSNAVAPSPRTPTTRPSEPGRTHQCHNCCRASSAQLSDIIPS